MCWFCLIEVVRIELKPFRFFGPKIAKHPLTLKYVFHFLWPSFYLIFSCDCMLCWQINSEGMTRKYYPGDTLPLWHEELEPQNSLLDILSSSSSGPDMMISWRLWSPIRLGKAQRYHEWYASSCLSLLNLYSESCTWQFQITISYLIELILLPARWVVYKRMTGSPWNCYYYICRIVWSQIWSDLTCFILLLCVHTWNC